MTTHDKCIKRKLSLLELAREMDNVSRACRIMGYSRTQFYEIRRQFHLYGSAGLPTPTACRRISSARFWIIALNTRLTEPPVSPTNCAWPEFMSALAASAM